MNDEEMQLAIRRQAMELGAGIERRPPEHETPLWQASDAFKRGELSQGDFAEYAHSGNYYMGGVENRLRLMNRTKPTHGAFFAPGDR